MALIDFETGEVKNLSTGTILRAQTLPRVAIQLLEMGGVETMLRHDCAKSDSRSGSAREYWKNGIARDANMMHIDREA